MGKKGATKKTVTKASKPTHEIVHTESGTVVDEFNENDVEQMSADAQPILDKMNKLDATVSTETIEDTVRPDNVAEFIVKCKSDGMNHEECEDELIKRGISSDDYGETLDKTYSKKTASDGADFLDGEGADEVVSETDTQKEARVKKEKEEEQALSEAEEIKSKQNELDAAEEGKSPLDKTHLLQDKLYDNSKEDVKPRPIKITEDLKSGGKARWTKWECPRCKSACDQKQSGWFCTSATCLYGKPKPLPESEVPQEIERYRLHIPELKANLTRVKMVYIGEGRYALKEGQGEYCSKQIIRVLQMKTWKQLNQAQIEYLAEWDKTKGLND